MPLGKGSVVRSAAEARQAASAIAGPVVVKSQVLSGGRMKAGAVQFADTPDEAARKYEQVLPIVVKGETARCVLVEEKSPIAQEYFASVTWDGRRKLPVLLFSDMGGIDIEEVAEKHPDHLSRTHFSTLLPLTERIAKEAIAKVGVSGDDLVRLTPIVFQLMQLFLDFDLTLAEINPLAKLESGKLPRARRPRGHGGRGARHAPGAARRARHRRRRDAPGAPAH